MNAVATTMDFGGLPGWSPRVSAGKHTAHLVHEAPTVAVLEGHPRPMRWSSWRRDRGSEFCFAFSSLAKWMHGCPLQQLRQRRRGVVNANHAPTTNRLTIGTVEREVAVPETFST